MHLTKHHGLGNDFLLAFVDAVPADGAVLARRLCHRTHGLGADGLIFCTDVAESASGVGGSFTLFNADGSRAEISGNGMRCFAHAVARRLGRSELRIDAATPAGPRIIEVHLDGSRLTATASVQMGPMPPLPITEGKAARIDALLGTLESLPPVLQWGTGDLGNPHIVLQVDDPFAADLPSVGVAVEEEFRSEFGGINVHLIAARSDGDGIDLRVWERGVGVTEACGSGACAAGALAAEWGIACNPVVVHMPGGSATIDLADSGITLTGPSVYIADVEVPDA